MREDQMQNWNEWLEDLNSRARADREITKSMFSDTTYIDWLYEFTKDKEGFFEDDWIYYPDRISVYDRENVEKLNLFYEGISNYAQKNYIYPTSCGYGMVYGIKYKDFCFEVGMLDRPEATCFMQKHATKNRSDYIDFNDIMINKEQEMVKRVEEALESLSQLIRNYHENGIPLVSIINTVDTTVKEIKSEEQEKPKKYVKESV